MFLPIGDENPRERTPYVNYALLAINIAAFFFFCFPEPRENILRDWCMRPELVSWSQPDTLKTLLTSMFLHANILHIAGNMLFLWIFGDNVEDRLGHIPYLIFYFLCGLAADLAHIATTGTPDMPTLGASGAISGVIGAYVLFFPKHRVKMLLWIFIYVRVFLIRAWIWVLIWFGEQLLFAALMAGQKVGGVAYGAHIGGFLGGLALAFIARLLYAGSRTVAGGVTPHAHPEEIGGASRWGDRSRPLFQPLVTVQEEDPGVIFVDEPSSRYALLRMSDELYNIGRIAAVTAGVTGERASDVARRIDASRGLIARDIPRAQAERIQITLKQQNLATLIVPYGPGFLPPTPQSADRLGWTERALSITAANQNQSIPWHIPFLYLGAVLNREPFIDIHVTNKFAVRVAGHTDLRVVDALQRKEMRGTLRDLSHAIIERSVGAALNDGVRVLAHRGSWGWLEFKRPEDFENYSFWLYNLILSQRPVHRYQR